MAQRGARTARKRGEHAESPEARDVSRSAARGRGVAHPRAVTYAEATMQSHSTVTPTSRMPDQQPLDVRRAVRSRFLARA